MRTRNFLIATTLAAGLLAATQAEAVVVLSENFESYADSTALRAAWTGSTATAFNLNTIGFDPAPTPLATQTGVTKLGRFASANSAYKALSAPIASTTSFTAQVDVLSEAYSRSNGFAITNATGTKGYVVQWNSSAVNSNGGRGVVSVNEYDSATPLSGAVFGTAQSGTRPIYATDPGTGLPTGSPIGFSTGTSTNAYHPGVGYRVLTTPGGTDSNTATYDTVFRGLSTLTLEYTAPATEGGPATLRLFTDGSDNPNPDTVAVLTITDTTPFTGLNFERFYVMGTSGNFDNISVNTLAVPEPASLGMVALCSAFLFCRRRRRETSASH